MAGDNYQWTGGGDGESWDDPDNWVDATNPANTAYPGSDDDAVFASYAGLDSTTGYAMQVTVNASIGLSDTDLTTQQLLIGSGAYDIDMYVSGGSLDLEGPATPLIIGLGGGSGTLNLTDGAQANALSSSADTGTASIVLGFDAGDSGTIVMDGGAVLTTDGDDIGGGGDGTVTITDGAQLIANVTQTDGFGFALGTSADGQGIVTVGDGGQLTADSGAGVGIGGDDSDMTIEAGGTLTASGITVGSGPTTGYTGSLTVTGTGAIANDSGLLVVGTNGDGAVTVAQGGWLSVGASNDLSSTDSVYLGADDGGLGVLIVTDAKTSMTVTGQVDVGLAGDGYLLLANGAAMTTGDATGETAEGIDIGTEEGGEGAIVITGSGTELTNTGQFIVGEDGDATLTIAAGAQVFTSIDAGLGTSGFDVATGQGSTGTVTITGTGTSLSATDIDLDGAGQADVTIADGAQVSDSGDFKLEPQDDGNATITLTGAATLLSVAGTVYVGGSGTGIATLNIADGATLDPPDLIIAPNPAPAVMNPPIDPVTGFRLDGIQVVNLNGGAALPVNQLIVGQAGNGALIVAGGDITADDTLTIGDQAGSQGQLLLDGNDSSLVSQDATIGNAGMGLLSIGNGNDVTTDGDATVGAEAGGNGQVLVGDGSGTSTDGADWSISGDLTIGDVGTGTVTVTPTSSLDAGGNIVIGAQSGSTSHLTFTGGTLAMSGGNITVGDEGSGSLLFQTGATLTGAGGPSVVIGATLGIAGAMTVTGDGTSVEIQDLTAGEAGTGSLTVVLGATLLVDGTADVGADAIGAIQKLTLDTGATMSVRGDLTLGTAAIASVSVKGGAQLVGDSNVVLGDGSGGGSGIVTVSGVSANLANPTPSGLGYGLTLTIGNDGIGNLTISAGALVAPTPGGTGAIVVAAGTGSQGTVTLTGSGSTLDGATLALGGSATAAGGLGKLSIGSGAAADISGDAHLWKSASLTLTGGTFSAATLTIDKTATVSGQGTLSGVVTDDGLIAASGGTLDVTGAVAGSGSLVIGSAATLQLGAAEAVPTIQFKGTGDTLLLNDPAALGSTLSGFTFGDTIDLAGVTATSAKDTSGTLDVYDGTVLLYSFKVAGNYQSATFDTVAGPAGTTITLDATQPAGLPVVAANPLLVSVPSYIIGEGFGAVGVAGLTVGDSVAGATVTVELLTATGVLAANTGATGGGGTITAAPDGTGLIITGSLDQVNADLSTLTYAATANGTDSIQAIATDSAGNADEDATFVIVPDEAPSIDLPGDQTVTALAPAAIGFSLSDSLSNGTTFTVTLSDTTGILVADQDGASDVAGSGTTTLVIVGDLDDVDDDLASLTYTGASTGLAASADDTIAVAVDDGNGGETDGTVAVTVDQAPDQTPFIDAPSAYAAPSVAPSAISDVSLVVGDTTDKTLSVTLSDVAGTLSVTQTGASVVTGDSSDDVTITGDTADVNADLVSLTYTGAADTFGTDTISLAVSDNFGLSARATITVTTDAVVFGPGTYTVTGPGSAATLTVEGGVTFTGSVMATGDADAFTVDDGGDATFGAGAVLTVAGAVIVGDTTAGTLNIVAGARAYSTSAEIAVDGSVVVDAANWTIADTFTIDGDVEVADGGSLTFDGGTLALGGYVDVRTEGTLQATAANVVMGDGGYLDLRLGAKADFAALDETGGETEIDDGTLAVAGTVTLAGGVLSTYTGATIDAAAIDILAGGAFYYDGGSLDLASGILMDGGALEYDLVSGPSAISGVTLTGGSDTIDGSGTFSLSVTYAAGADATLIADSGNLASVSGFARGDVLDLANITYSAADTVTLLSGNVLSITTPGDDDFTVQLSPADDFGGDNFVVNADVYGDVAVRLTGQLGATFTWASPTDGSFADPAAWTPAGGPPGPDETAIFGPGTYTVSSNATVGQIDVDGAVTFTGNILALGVAGDPDAVIVDAAGSLTLTADASLTAGDGTTTLGAIVGDAGSGTLTADAGAAITLDGALVIGNGLAASGTITIDDAVLGVGADLAVGDQGAGRLLAEAQGAVYAASVEIGATATGSGTVALDDATLEASTLAVGGTADQAGGQGALTITGGTAAVTDATVWTDGTITLQGGTLAAEELVVQAGGILSGSGDISGSIVLDGAIAVATNAALQLVTTSIGGTGSLVVSSGGTLVLDFGTSLANSSTLSFAAGSTLDLRDDTLTTAQLVALDTGAPSLVLDQGTVLTNGDATLDIGAGAALGTVTLAGTITGGTIADAGGGLVGAYGTLAGVTYQGTLSMTAQYDNVTAAGGITLEGAGGAGPGAVALTGQFTGLNILGTTTLDDATITIANDSALSVFDDGAPAVLTLGSALSIVQTPGEDFTTGATLQDGGGAGDGIVNDGSITTAGTGNYFYVQGNSFANQAVISVAAGGFLTVQSSIFVNTGSIAIGAAATLDLAGATDDDGTIAFDGAAGTLQVDAATLPGDMLFGFAPGDTIDLTAIAYDPNWTDSLLTGNELQFVENGATYDLHFDPSQSLATDNFVLSDPSGGTVITLASTACYCRGTRILTDRGEVPVEALRIGDAVVTLSGALRPVRWIGHRRLDLACHPAPSDVCPVRIAAGALADSVPARDLLVSPDHAMLVGGVLLPARLLLNGASVTRVDAMRHVTYFHVELDTHDILFADGAPAESYLDTGNRDAFDNAGLPVRLHPEFAGEPRLRAVASCRPLATAPALVEPVWRAVAARAAVLGWALPGPLPMTDDPDLHVLADGRRISPVIAESDHYVFVLPACDRAPRLVSRAARPSEPRPWLDDRRRLGVQIARLVLRQRADVTDMPMDNPTLSDGWWDVEQTHRGPCRWTDGSAALPSMQASVVEVKLAGRMQYPLRTYQPKPRRPDRAGLMLR